MLGTELNQIQKIADALSRREYGAGFYTLDHYESNMGTWPGLIDKGAETA